MTPFKKNQEDPLKYVSIITAENPHIQINNEEICLDNCENKPCTYYCPGRVCSWSDDEQKIIVEHERCIECGACPWGCPYDNIYWEYPPGGYGVHYEI